MANQIFIETTNDITTFKKRFEIVEKNLQNINEFYNELISGKYQIA